MTDLRHQKFEQMMNVVATLEDEVAIWEKGGMEEASLLKLKEQLAEARNRLAQFSDGCGTGHNPSV